MNEDEHERAMDALFQSFDSWRDVGSEARYEGEDVRDDEFRARWTDE